MSTPTTTEIIMNISELMMIEASKDPAGIPNGNIKEFGNRINIQFFSAVGINNEAGESAGSQ